MFYMRESPKGYGKNTKDEIAPWVEGVSNLNVLKGKRILNIDEQLGIQPPHVKKIISALDATLCEYGSVWEEDKLIEARLIWGPEPEELKDMYGVHSTDLVTSGGNSEKAILALREAGATIEYCHFVIKRGDKGIKNLSDKKIDAGANLDQDDIIAAAAEKGMFTPQDMDMLDDFDRNPRAFNERFLKTVAGHKWITKMGPRGEKIIREGYSQLLGEYPFNDEKPVGWGDGTR
jgi:hypothetical protein